MYWNGILEALSIGSPVNALNRIPLQILLIKVLRDQNEYSEDASFLLKASFPIRKPGKKWLSLK